MVKDDRKGGLGQVRVRGDLKFRPFGERGTIEKTYWDLMYLTRGRSMREQRPAQRLDNSPQTYKEAAVSRHRLDSLNTSNDLLKKQNILGSGMVQAGPAAAFLSMCTKIGGDRPRLALGRITHSRVGVISRHNDCLHTSNYFRKKTKKKRKTIF